MAIDIKAGIYKGRVVRQPSGDWAQYGDSKNENPELLLDIDLRLDDVGNVRRVTTPLYFSLAAAPYSFDRLRACGWEGSDLSDLTGVDKNEISVEVKHEPWLNPESGQNEMKTKFQIMSGAGRFNTAKPVEAKAFAARVAAITGAPAPQAGIGPKPTF
jgi:hypothetical protein